MNEELQAVEAVVTTEIKPVVKAGWEEIHKILTDKLTNLKTDIETKVNEYREQLLAESNDTGLRLTRMIEDCVEYVEVPVTVTETEAVTEEV